MKIKTLQYEEFISNTHLAFISETEVIAFDAGHDNESLLKYLANNNLKLVAVFLTHGHFDHIRGLRFISKDIPVYMFESEKELLTNPYYNGSKTYPPEFIISREVIGLKDGQILEFNQYKIKVIHTPFHTEGSVCYLLDENHLISGDTLFKHTIGRIDLVTSAPRKVRETLGILAKLHDVNREIHVYPGHGANTTLAHEIEYNRYFRNK